MGARSSLKRELLRIVSALSSPLPAWASEDCGDFSAGSLIYKRHRRFSMTVFHRGPLFLLRISLVDIRLAFASGVINVDGLQLRVKINGDSPHFAQSHARAFHPTERHLCLAAHGGGIHMR